MIETGSGLAFILKENLPTFNQRARSWASLGITSKTGIMNERRQLIIAGSG